MTTLNPSAPLGPDTRSRRGWRTRAGATSAAAALALALAACGGTAGGGGAATGGGSSTSDTVTIALDSDAAPNGYDPLLYASGQFQFYSALYDALFVTGADGKVTPSLVTDFKNNADNTQLTLTLKDGVTFTDGSTLDATLVKENLDRRSNKDLTSYGSFATGGATEITDVSAPDAKTVVITWKTPQATGQNNLADTAGIIVGKTAAEKPDSLATTPDGSGPYTLDTGATTKGSKYTLTKNTKAWNAGAFAFTKTVWNIISDPQARANAVVSGQADIGYNLDGTTVDLVKSKQSIAQVGGTIIGWPVTDKTGVTNPAFADPNVRLALSYGIDRATIVKDLHPGARATAQLFPQGTAGFDDALDTQYAYNPDKAKQLLATAGYPSLTIDVTVLGQPTTDQVAVQKQWQAIGVTLNFKVATSTDAVFAAVNTDPLLFGPFTVGSFPLGFVQGVLYGGFMNQQKATDPNIDKAIGQAASTTGAQQETALKDLNAAITNDGWFIGMYESFVYTGYNASKVAQPSYAGTNNWLVLSSVKPKA